MVVGWESLQGRVYAFSRCSMLTILRLKKRWRNEGLEHRLRQQSHGWNGLHRFWLLLTRHTHHLLRSRLHLLPWCYEIGAKRRVIHSSKIMGTKAHCVVTIHAETTNTAGLLRLRIFPPHHDVLSNFTLLLNTIDAFLINLSVHFVLFRSVT